MKFWVFLVLAFVVLLSSCQIFFLAGVYEELQDRGIVSGGTENIPNTSSSIVYIYVSRNGNDANDGLSPSTPVKDLVRAMEVANNIDSASNVLIKVGSGVYTNGDGLSTNVGLVVNRPNLIISGGWDSDFTTNTNVSGLDGNNNLYHVVMITNVTNVRLENLVIRGGNANGSYPDNIGGGIYVSEVSYLVIESSVVIKNNSAYYGGGVFLWYSTNTTISGNVYGNSANSGGGVYLYYSTNTTISGSICDNSANNSGGGLYLDNSTNTTISGSVYGNSATYDGGGLYLWNSTSTTISGSVYGNSATNSGGGVYLDNSDYFTNTGWITNNTAGYDGGGVYRSGSYANSYFTNVTNNSPNNFNW
jgi:parallel beta-helix repeat protein